MKNSSDSYAKCSNAKLDSVQEQMAHVSREMVILRQNQKKMLGVCVCVCVATNITNACDGLSRRIGIP